MMMKIFGAVLIVSGGYMIGNVKVRQTKKRLKLLEEISGLLEQYLLDLKQFRRSLKESMNGRGSTAEQLSEGVLPNGVTSEDRLLINTLFEQLKGGSYKQSITATSDILQKLQSTIHKLKEETAAQGKALPLVTGAIGFLIAVLLF